jgi:cytochrome c oxidase subunit 2
MIRTEACLGRGGERRLAKLLRATSPLLLLLIRPATAAAESSSPFLPASPNAAAVKTLFVIILAIAAVIFVGVEGVLLYSLTRFRYREGRPTGQFTGHLRLEIVWTTVPAIILAVVYYLTVQTTLAISSPPTGDPLDVDVTAHQFWWEVRYRQDGVVTANELHVPVGETVVIHLTSSDVVHSFWVPSLAPKWDAVPGQPRTLWFNAQSPGIFQGYCSEYCGIAHTWMQFPVQAESAIDYQVWVRAQNAPAATPTGGGAARGLQIYQSQTCGNCHAISGLGSTASVGPNLTHVASRPFIAGGVLANTPQNMYLWLQDPPAVKPGVSMPNYRFAPSDLQALTAYMESLR